MTKHQKSIQMAVIGAAHGIKGEVRIKSFTGEPLALGSYGPLHSPDGRIFEIVDLRPQGNILVARFKGINDRNAAETLNGTRLFVGRSVLPDDLEDGEFYHADLVGLTVKDEQEKILGKVISVHNYGAGDILAVKSESGGEVLVPFTCAAITDISLSGGYLVVDTLAAGLTRDEAAHEKGKTGDRS